MIQVVPIVHVARITQIEIRALGAFPSKTLNSFCLAIAAYDVWMPHACTKLTFN
jgi:hypothetical protein